MSMSKTVLSGVLALALLAVACGCSDKAALEPAQQSGNSPPLPTARDFLLPPMQVPIGVGWAQGQTPTVARGLKIDKIAGGLMHPRQVYVLPNGDVLVAESNGPGTEPVTTPKQLIANKVKNLSGKGGKGGNRITLLRKKDGAVEWEKHVLLEHLHSPFGMALIGDSLYVANTDAIMKFPYHTGDTEVEYRRAVVLEVDVATRGSRIYASGIRNPTGLGWEPETNKLWAVANERDEIGADLVPDYLTSVKDGGFYGWPFSYYGQIVDRRVAAQRPDLVAKAIVPDYAIGSHVAPLGVWFSAKNALPDKYQRGVFISEHGSWDRSPLSGYEVVHVAFEQGKPVGKPETVVSGFYSADEKKLFGAPVGITQDQDGALLIADDVGDAVWRVTSDAGH
jgi:glucose/arabinose dehydrogenase